MNITVKRDLVFRQQAMLQGLHALLLLNHFGVGEQPRLIIAAATSSAHICPTSHVGRLACALFASRPPSFSNFRPPSAVFKSDQCDLHQLVAPLKLNCSLPTQLE